MKAIIYHRYGTADELNFKEVEKPIPKDDEVLINVHTASINSWDWDLLRGSPLLVRIGGLRKPKFNILGADIAGRVEAVGRKVRQFVPGDEVFGDLSGCNWGGFAEYVCASEKALSLKPTHISFEDAAAMPQAAVLALQGLRDKGLIRKGHKVLVNGAGRGVGTFAIQLAKYFGAEVTGVDSLGKLADLQSIGADHVIDYAQDDFTANGQRYDLILDIVGTRSILDCKRALNPKGQYVMVGGPMYRILQVMLVGPLISMFGTKKMGLLLHKPNKKDQNELMELRAAGNIVPVMDRHYPLGDVAQALHYFGEGRHVGKIMIHVK
ncbi:NAD(P)-dependent alcohol dehydrogenase [Paenibacillus qinlingensis]|uniref:NADPH:quinone reductase-like Zn-dependent oxidoreductase n=1 Tax=Paenibacillus qinlingensis TaxID=1837343 RepID=A0ABU1NRC3_9BACL|nr:NAD(P)-dependent alcohol dehydrogenase [Paenibacillus qinlingensis]MDR6549995.1 NADPH:quinone reductase-like Zn-dependent oxidoreductase [Paenibacillus qinlingensis]